MLRSVLSRALPAIAALCLLTGVAQATDVILSHQGRLLDATDHPITGTRTITFRLYEVPTGGAPLWTEVHVSIPIADGLFDVLLGSVTPLSVDLLAPSGSSPDRWLALQVLGDDQELQPRRRLTSGPFAGAASRITGDIVTSPGQLKLGEVDHGKLEMVTSADSAVSDCVQGAQGNQNIVKIKVTPSDAGVFVARDGSTTGTIRATNSGGHVVLSGHSGSTTGTIRMTAAPDSTGSTLASDSDGNGEPESSVSYKTSGPRATGTLSGMSGSTTGTIRMQAAGDSAVSTVESDSDGNGDAESGASTKTSSTGASQALYKKGLNAVNVKTALVDSVGDAGFVRRIQWDIDNDGTYDMEANTSGDAGGTRSVIRGGMSGSTTGTIRMQASSDSASSVHDCDSDGDGHSETTIRIRARDAFGNPESSMELSTDTDDDGVTDNSVVSASDNSGSSQRVLSLNGLPPGTPVIGSLSMATTPSSSSLDVGDIDGDGVYRILATTDSVVREISVIDNGPGGVALMKAKEKANRTKCSSNLRATGAGASHELDESCDLTRASSKAITTKGTGAIAMTKMETGDSAKVSSLYDDDGNGVAEMSAEMETDPDGASLRLNGLPPGTPIEGTLSMTASGSGARSALEGRSGSTTGTIRMAATSDSASSVHECDEDGDGHAEARGIIAVKSPTGSGSPSSSSRMTCDSDDDGVADVTAEMEANADSASLRLNGLPPGVPVTGTISMTASPSGAHMSVGAATCNGTNWVNASDRNAKENFEKVDGEELLNKVAELDITKWNYKNDKETEHIGPTAQDFKATFGVGSDGKSISTIDPSGIALAAIKELYAQLKSKDKEMDEQLKVRDRQISELREQLEKLQRLIKKN